MRRGEGRSERVVLVRNAMVGVGFWLVHKIGKQGSAFSSYNKKLHGKHCGGLMQHCMIGVVFRKTVLIFCC